MCFCRYLLMFSLNLCNDFSNPYLQIYSAQRTLRRYTCKNLPHQVWQELRMERPAHHGYNDVFRKSL